MTSSYCFCVLEYILLITIDPFFHSLSINCIIFLFGNCSLFVYTYFIRVPARKEPQRFLYCCTAAGMVQSERENADKIRLHLFYWGNVRRFFNHEKKLAVLAAAAVAAGILLGGCGGSKSGGAKAALPPGSRKKM